MINLIEETARAAVAAAARIKDHIERTPLQHSAELSERYSADVYLKLENLQKTGSFKLRGATNRLMTLDARVLRHGCVAASSGNHGAAVAAAMQSLGLHGTIFVPTQTSAAKVEKIRGYGGDVQFFGDDGLDTEQHARAYAEDNGMRYLSPYNDREVIAGQGSCGVELLQQVPEIDEVFVAVGGGGLVGGVGSVLKTSNAKIEVTGCQPEASAVMARSIEAGEILDLPSEPTLSDGTAGGIESGAITFPLNQRVVDRFITVSEREIAAAMRDYYAMQGHVIEGAAGVAIAALHKSAARIAGRKVVVIVCGGNISNEAFERAQAGE